MLLQFYQRTGPKIPPEYIFIDISNPNKKAKLFELCLINLETFFYIVVCSDDFTVSKYEVFPVTYFVVFGLNTENDGVNLSIQSECGKIRT